MKKLILLSTVIGFFTTSFAFADAKDFYVRRALEKRQPHSVKDWGLELFLASTMNQKIDHSNGDDARTFSQRYYLSPSAGANPKTPVLLYICGESTCNGGSEGEMVQSWADQLGASIAVLEHRYYGASQPFATLSAENMKYLTVENALEDLASFQKEVMKDPRFQGPWIVIGGSYAGTLSAYYRLKHPELVVGALASSAPVRAKVDFEEYDLAVAQALPADCATKIRSAVAEIEKRLADPATHDSIKQTFDAADVKDDTDFLFVVADMAAVAAQYGHTDDLCGAMNNGDPVAAYAEAGKKLFSWFGLTPVQDSSQGALSEDPADYYSSFGMRQWLYQTCSQFGFFQVAYHDPAVSVRSGRLNVNFMNQMCKNIFNLDPVNVNPINTSYYQALFAKESASHIIFSNGELDPWARLSITKELGNNTNPETDSVTIPGGSHCTDISGGGAAEEARRLTLEKFKSWIKQN